MRDGVHRHALRLVRRDLLGEHAVGEVPLQLLVGEVDAQLLERVLLERLEAEDVQQPDVVVLPTIMR